MPYAYPYPDGQIVDARYASNPNLSVSNTKDRQMLGYVKVGFDFNNHNCFGNGYQKYTITLNFNYTELTTYPGTYNVVSVTDKKFVIEYDPANTTKYKESAIFYIKNAYKIEDIEVTNITLYDAATSTTTTTLNTTDVLDNMYIEATLDAEMYKNFNPANAPSGLQAMYVDFAGNGITPNPNDYKNSIVFKWDAVTNGETDIELEWTYINDYGVSDYDIPADKADLSFTFINNATRVRIPAGQTEYVIPAMYDRGYVAARIRGIGRDFNNLDREIRSKWSTKCDVGDVILLEDDPGNDYVVVSAFCQILEDDNSQANWLSSATFVEEGKNKFVVSYGDGSGRARQQVTLSSSDTVAIATETFYDHQGRGTVQAMPSPVLVKYAGESVDIYAKNIQYFNDLNRNLSGDKYSRVDFDFDPTEGCTVAAGPFINSIGSSATINKYAGAGRYYSTNNPIKDGAQAFVPESGGYPFTISQFTADNTGRIRKQSGVGTTHTIDGDHATRYYYTTVDQVELDRLFGTDAGYANYYQKMVVVDANGQASISYTDMNGKTVATALVGDAPSNVLELTNPDDDSSIPDAAATTVTEDLIKRTNNEPLGMSTMVSADGMSLTVTNHFVVTNELPYTFNYSVEVEKFTDECITGKCLSCKYKLAIVLKDECSNIFVNINETIGGSSEILTDCESSTLYNTGTGIVTDPLPFGEYTLVKTLTIDDAALWGNVDLYMDNSTCLKTIEDFMPVMDVSACDLTCDDCTAKMAAMGATVDAYITSLGTISPLDEVTYRNYYNLLKQECDVLCQLPSVDNCGGLLQNMLADMTPGGQYAMYKANTDPAFPGTYIHDGPVSVLSEASDNALPTEGGYDASWKHPNYFDPATHTLTGLAEYRDEYGVRNKIALSFDINGVPSPAVDMPAHIFTDVDGSKYTYPEFLANVTDFINVFTQTYAQSLIVYHPEYLGYEWCATRVYTPTTVDFVDIDRDFNSNQFDYFLKNTTVGAAQAALGSSLDIVSKDPIIVADPTLLTPLRDFLDQTFDIGNTYYNVYQAAIINTELAGWYSIDTEAEIDNHFNTTYGCTTCTGAIITDDDVWDVVVEYYLSAKAKLVLTKSQVYAFSQGVCWWCIGNENTPPGVGPCSITTDQYYRDKQPRIFNFMGNANEALGFADGVDIHGTDSYRNVSALSDYKYWETTGNCPIARDIELMINQLIDKDELLTTSPVPLTPGTYLTYPVYQLFGGEDGTPVIQNYLPTVTSGNLELTWTPAASSVLASCSTPLTLTIPSGYDSYMTLDNILQIYGIHDVNWTGTYTEFKLNAYFVNPAAAPNEAPVMREIDGKICINLQDCDMGGTTQCLPTPQTNNLLQIMNALSFDGTIDENITLTGDYLAMVGPELRAMLGPGALHWTYAAGPIFELKSDNLGTPTITINISGYETTNIDINNPALFTRIYTVSNIIDPAPITPTSNLFKIDFVQPFSPTSPDPLVLYGLNNVSPTGKLHGDITYTNSTTSMPFVAIDCQTPAPVYCNSTENLNFEQLKDLLNICVQSTSINSNVDGVECMDNLILTSTGTPITNFTGILSIINVVPDYTQSIDGLNTYYFTATVATAAGTDHITGRYCHPIRDCQNPCPPVASACVDLFTTIEYPLTESDMGSAMGKLFILGNFMDGDCVPVGNDVPLEYNTTIYTSHEDFLDAYIAYTNFNNPVLSLSRTGLTLKVTLPTWILGVKCECGTTFESDFPVIIQAPGEPESVETIANGTMVSCCKIPEDPSDCVENALSIHIAYVIELVDAFEEYKGLLAIWADDCATMTPAECDDAKQVIEDWYSDEKATIIATYQPLLDYAIANCPDLNTDPEDVIGEPSADCHQQPTPFTLPEPYVNSCEDDMNNLADATAQMLYDQYIEDQRNTIYNTLKTYCLNNVVETFTKEYHLKEYHYTLYYYDQAGNLYRTVPPLAVKPITDATALADMDDKREAGDEYLPDHADNTKPEYALITQYRFNSLNQPIEQKTPDGGLANFFYDSMGRLIYSQNAKQAPNNQYSYTKFDNLGRISEVGQLENPNALTLVLAANPDAITGLPDWEDDNDNYEQITKTYYDENIFIGLVSSYNLRNRVAATLYFEDPDLNYNSGTFYSYDILGNVKQLWQYNADMPEDHQLKTMHYYYDLASGKVNAVAYQPEGNDRFFHKYKYDADNRLTATYTWQGADWETIGFTDRNWNATVLPLSNLEHVFPFDEDARYFYYDHGPGARTEIGHLNVQGVDYVYTLQGWIKGVNSTTLNHQKDPGLDGYITGGNANSYVARDAYSYSLDYFNGDFSAIDNAKNNFVATKAGSGFGSTISYLYNGNIAAMTTTLRQLNNNINAFPQGMVYQYDQLNRIKTATAFADINVSGNTWNTETPTAKYFNSFRYDANGNIMTQLRNGEATAGGDLDDLTYKYYAGTNRLEYVDDAITSAFTDDIDDQNTGNYTYDAIGNMTSDYVGGIDNIVWSVYGKIKFIDKTGGATDDITFSYGPDGNRITKSRNVIGGEITYYVRDASGNIMATYNYTVNDDCFTLDEHPLYGSSRLGVRTDRVCVDEDYVPEEGTEGIVYVVRGYKNYELSNHLGNVLTVITDRRTAICGTSDVVENYDADVITVTDYYAFGSPMAGRTHSQDLYRFGFNGQEHDDEIGGVGNIISYEYRIEDSRLGRFLSIDPLSKNYPFFTPYQFASNQPIHGKELEGLENEKTQGSTQQSQPPAPTGPSTVGPAGPTSGSNISGPTGPTGAPGAPTTNGPTGPAGPTGSQSPNNNNNYTLATSQNADKISNVSLGETEGLYPVTNTTNPSYSDLSNPDKWDENMTKQLLEARAGINYIYTSNRNTDVRTKKADVSTTSKATLATYHLTLNFPEVAAEIKDDESVKFFYLAKSPTTKHTGISSKYWDQKVVKSYGPFYNIGGGDAPKGPLYINFYSATKKR